MNIPKTEQAKDFCRTAHDSIGQVRKYSGLPYWTHPNEVAETVASVPGATEDMICAAYLHDVLEDVFPENPICNRAWIKKLFGQRTLDLVEQLTDHYTKERYPKLNRAERKAREVKRMAATDNEAKTIKLADILSNTRDIVEADPEFAKVYLAEKRAMMPALVGGDHELWKRASEQAG